MNIATVLNVHDDTDCVVDTIESIQKYVGERILVVVDGASWEKWGKNLQISAYKLEGFWHGCNRAPYRNMALGMKQAWQLWGQEIDWICYTEYDCLFGSDEFKEYLKKSAELGAWCVGNDFRQSNLKFPLLERMLKAEFNFSAYLLGCCVFYKSDFIRKLVEIDFFNRFLYLTNEFSKGFFPGYEEQGGYDLSEHLYPTLATHLGGKVAQLAVWSEASGAWAGEYKKFPFRFRPELEISENLHEFASILHPVKNYNNAIRIYHRRKRKGKS